MELWWSGFPAQRYWMETSDAARMGNELFAPRGGTGHQDLVQHVQPGDVILHWAKGEGLIGTSIALGPLRIEERDWAGRRGPSWVMPLAEFEPTPALIGPSDLSELERELRDAYRLLKDAYPPFKFFPFDFFEKRSPRPHQGGYLTKFPLELFEVFARAGLDAPTLFDAESGQQAERLRLAPHGPRYLTETKLRVGVENYSVRKTKRWYEQQGAGAIRELGKPYDLELELNSTVRRVEVKGSTQRNVASVLLTRNEVRNAMSYIHTDLVVVDSIDFEVADDGDYHFSGGELRNWSGWTPRWTDLEALEYSYRLPLSAA